MWCHFKQILTNTGKYDECPSWTPEARVRQDECLWGPARARVIFPCIGQYLVYYMPSIRPILEQNRPTLLDLP